MIKSTLSIIEKENSYDKLVSIVKYNMYSKIKIFEYINYKIQIIIFKIFLFNTCPVLKNIKIQLIFLWIK